MATIACPGCGKQFKLSAEAAGKTATCKCGKRFKIAAPAKAAPVAAAATAALSKPQPAHVAVPTPKPVAKLAAVERPLTDDNFWDEGLAEPIRKPVAPAPVSLAASAGPATTATRRSPVAAADAPKKKRKKKSSFHWGADWGKALGGLGTFCICGGIAVVGWMNGYIYPYAIVFAIGGLITALSGLMGD